MFTMCLHTYPSVFVTSDSQSAPEKSTAFS